MRLLLDTHTFIWYVTNDRQISTLVLELVNDGNNDVLLSIASIWEMAIKHSTGKLSFALPFEIFISQQMSLNKFNLLNININHLTVVASLPFHHRDPFDRLLISQAMVEQLPILSIDPAFDSYPIQRLW
jgi:PIN domain nuclease of toxin-antitoxin system